MAALMQGFLREEKATYGEKEVYRLLKYNLPKEFSVYVECPLPGKRIQRYPDFIVLTNYGVIVLEVKDWYNISNVNRYGLTVHTRQNESRTEGNPVNQARELAILLSDELKRVPELLNDRKKLTVGWGYAVVFPNLPTSTITQLRRVWGEEFVLNKDDLGPDLITARLKCTIPSDQARPLNREEIDYIRAAINPTVLIEPPDKPVVILDEQQERLVVAGIREEAPEPKKQDGGLANQTSLFGEPAQSSLFTSHRQETGHENNLAVSKIEEQQPEEARHTGNETVQSDDILPQEEKLATSSSIRLIRGVAGSGKSLVLTQRARYLAAQYPEWNIAVLTYNDELAKSLSASLKSCPNIKTMKFHDLCKKLLRGYMPWKVHDNPDGWLNHQKSNFSIIEQLGVTFLTEEIKWIKDTSIRSREEYLEVERRGRGQQVHLARRSALREQIYDLYEAYSHSCEERGVPDWADVPHFVLQGIEEGKIRVEPYDALLIDEAQDFAPSWIKVVLKVLKPESGVLFLADDPAQSIYKFYSWREKGIPVVGRTRHLRTPYRNTYEIYQAAYELIRSDETLQSALGEEGVLVEPDMNAAFMRHGSKPLFQKFKTFDEEAIYVRDSISSLLQNGYKPEQIAVLSRRTRGVDKISRVLKGLGVNIGSFHAYKGLEFEAVFLSQLQETFQETVNPQGNSEERRLVYMAMTRARQQLVGCYQGILPAAYRSILPYVDSI